MALGLAWILMLMLRAARVPGFRMLTVAMVASFLLTLLVLISAVTRAEAPRATVARVMKRAAWCMTGVLLERRVGVGGVG
ncbi:MAG: hypothetical protein J3R72DRAFT_460310 [Linnemannia gamsii]|nr:MAG: hypothetical protein J3R72DRAFT_460310 [Linnemannia gamsii]